MLIINKNNENQKTEIFNESIPEGWTDQIPNPLYPNKWENDEWVTDISKFREMKKQSILDGFNNELQTGHFMSTAIGIEVDCRRTTSKNDLQNVQGLLSNFNRKSKIDVPYVGYTEIATNIKAQDLEDLSHEMEDYFLSLYEKKWVLQTSVEACTTIEELNAISWEEV